MVEVGGGDGITVEEIEREEDKGLEKEVVPAATAEIDDDCAARGSVEHEEGAGTVSTGASIDGGDSVVDLESTVTGDSSRVGNQLSVGIEIEEE